VFIVNMSANAGHLSSEGVKYVIPQSFLPSKVQIVLIVCSDVGHHGRALKRVDGRFLPAPGVEEENGARWDVGIGDKIKGDMRIGIIQ